MEILAVLGLVLLLIFGLGTLGLGSMLKKINQIKEEQRRIDLDKKK